MINPTYITSVYTAPSSLTLPDTMIPGAQIFVGSYQSATNSSVLQANNISSILNVAYDLNDQTPTSAMKPLKPDPARPWQADYAAPAPGGNPAASQAQQNAKVGLIDGVGNWDTTLVSTVYMADQLICFPPFPPSPPLNTTFPPGNLLIHCFSGHSRSVTIASLYIYYRFVLSLGDTRWSNFLEVYLMVQAARGDFNPPPPTLGMQEAAGRIVAAHPTLFPKLDLSA